MVYKISDLIRRPTISGTPMPKSKYLEPAVNLVKKSIKVGKISLIQGPPGTGKTTVFELSIDDLFDTISSDYILLYEAPTNKLVQDMLRRVAAIYAKRDRIEDIAKEVRVYGSQFDYSGFEGMVGKVDRDVKMILSTDYQRPYFTSNKQICLLIDEASKTPLHQPFIAFTGKIIQKIGKPEMWCISVVGDPKQAITLGHHYREEGRKLLFLNSVIEGFLKMSGNKPSEDITKDAREHLSGEVFEFLSYTHRMPSPTEVAISKAYYGGSLHSTSTVEERLKNVWDHNRAFKLSAINEEFKKAVKIAEEAITTSRGIIYIKIDQDYPYGDQDNALLFEPRRGEAGIYLATCLSLIAGMNTVVLTTYTDQWQQMKLMFQRELAPLVKSFPDMEGRVSFGTVDRHVGSEEEIVVCVLGKEGCSKNNKTRYFEEPELLNVQLSRHRRLLCIVGNLQKLRNTARKLNSEYRTLKFREVAEVSEALMEQAGFEIYKHRARHVRTGDDCVFSEWA